MTKSPTEQSKSGSRDRPTPEAEHTTLPADRVNIFISYASADAGIAAALFEELSEIDHNRVVCFLDTETIGSGRDWKKRLDSFLQSADWLVCVYTGEQSEFCGYEIGVFEQVNNLTSGGTESPVVCLHDVPTLPTVFAAHQNRLVKFPPDASTQNKQFNESDFYLHSPLAKFFSDLYAYKGLYVAKDASEAQRQAQTLLRQVKRITDAFKDARGSDIRADTPTKDQIDVQIDSSTVEPLIKIPDSAKVVGTYSSLALFGLRPPMQNKQLPVTTWRDLKQAGSSKYRTTAPWVECIEQDMLAAANAQVSRVGEAVFSANDKVYRAILSRHIIYENGAQTFQILFVETLPRQFLGKKHTSLMLAGIVLAARFKFAYLEENDTIENKFGDTISNEDFESNCWQLHFDLDRLRQEAIELGIFDPVEFIKAFGDDKRGLAENMMKISVDSRNKLYEILPGLGEHFNAMERPKITAAIHTYFSEISQTNERFIIEALDVLRTELVRQSKVSAISRQFNSNGKQ